MRFPKIQVPKVQNLKRAGLILVGLVVFVALVVGLRYYIESKRAKVDTRPKIFSFSGTQRVDRVRVYDSSGKVIYQFACKIFCSFAELTAKWQIEKPIVFPGSSEHLNALLSDLADLRSYETLKISTEEEWRLARYGFGKDAKQGMRIELKLRDIEQPYALQFSYGSGSPHKTYVLAEGPGMDAKNIHLVSGALRDRISPDLEYWRSRILFDFNAKDVISVSGTNFKGSFEVLRDGDIWSQRDGTLVDGSGISKLIESIIRSTVKGYVSDDRKRDAVKVGMTGAPVFRFEFKITDWARPFVVEVYKVRGPTYMRYLAAFAHENFVFEMEPAFAERLNLFTIENIAKKNPHTADEKQEISRVEIVFQNETDGRFVFVRPEKLWEVDSRSAKVKDFKSGMVEILLAKVSGMEMGKVVGRNTPPSSAKLISTWRLTRANGGVVSDFDMFEDNDGLLIRLRTGEIMRLKKGLADSLPKAGKDISW